MDSYDIPLIYLEKYPAEACRGFFDAEGWAEAYYYRIVADNTNSSIIDLFGLLLEKLDINYKIYQCHQNGMFVDPKSGKTYRRNSEFIIYLLAIYGEENITS